LSALCLRNEKEKKMDEPLLRTTETDDKDKGLNSGFWLGMIFGGIVGAVVTYLATEDKSQLKKSLLEKGKILLEHWDDFKDEVEEKGKKLEKVEKKFVGELEETKEEAQEMIAEIPAVAQDAVERVQQEANEAIANIVKTADNAEIQAHRQARKFFLSKGRPLVKK